MFAIQGMEATTGENFALSPESAVKFGSANVLIRNGAPWEARNKLSTDNCHLDSLLYVV